MIESWVFAAALALAAVTVILVRVVKEITHAESLVADLKGKLRRGLVLRPESIHADFRNRIRSKPSLLFVTANACGYCKLGFQALLAILPPGMINLCVAYDENEGHPQWLKDLPVSNLIAVPFGVPVVERLNITAIPRWILLSRHDRVLLDLQGYHAASTVRQLAQALGLKRVPVE